MKKIFGGKTGLVLLLLVVLLLVGLPVAVWLDLTNLTRTSLNRQASDLNSIISSVRSYYASNVVGRILSAPGVATKVVHNYQEIPGAIPIPATLSLELGKVISEQQHNSLTASSPTIRSPTALPIRSTSSKSSRCANCAKIPTR